MNNSSQFHLGEMSSFDNSNGRKLCSLCGLCMVKEWSAKEGIQGCVFTLGWLGEQESSVFGRERSHDDCDEMLFGISKERFVARIQNPIPSGQFTGIITNIAKKAFETGLVEAVVTLHRSKEDYFLPEPVLARSTEEILASGGSKPVLATTLASLVKAYKQGIKRLLVIGASCQVQNLREFKSRFPYLKDMDIYVVGIPCTDNVHPKNFRYILSKISRSHETVRHYEFMQDFTVHLRHVDGSFEKVPFFCLPKELSRSDLLAACCRSCFDYMNSLADITVGYMAAPLDVERMYQWVIVRTNKGNELYKLIADELEIFPETSEGDCKSAVQNYAQQILDQLKQEGEVENGSEVSMSLEEGMQLAEYLYSVGPRGLEWARYAIETHLIRNYYFVKSNYPELLTTLVPKTAYHVLEEYNLVDES